VQAGASIMAAAAAGEPPAAGVPAGCHGLSCAGEAFLGGVLARLPGLLPFLLPSANSYARLQPCCWSGAFLCWGYENREAPLRVCCPAGGPGGVNIEVKCVDGTTNPYIGLAALLAAGMQGLDAPDAAALPPPVHADPSAGDGGSGGATPRQPLQRLPASLGAALQELEGDARVQGVVQEVLGPELVTAYLAVRRAEAAATVPPDALLLRY
jgi:glutamine synthetase